MNQADETDPAGGWAFDPDEPRALPGKRSAEQALDTLAHALGYAPGPVPGPTWSDPHLRPGPTGGVGVLQGLVDAMRLLPAVGKDNEHKGDRTGTWSYRSADAVVSAVGPALAQAGVVLLPILNDDQPIELAGNPGWRLDMTYRFFGVDGSSLSFRMISHSVGQTAYTIGAGYSYALKYALSQALCLPFDDPRMDMESSSSHGATVHWWQDGGWESAEQHDQRRAALFEALKGMEQERRGPIVARLAGMRDHPVYNPGGYKVAGGSIWTPTEIGNPEGPGRLVARLSVAAMDAADELVGTPRAGSDDGVADDGLPADPEFDVDGPGDEPTDPAPAPDPAPVADEPKGRRPRGSRRAQEATEPAGATETAVEPGEAQGGAAGAAPGQPADPELSAEQIKASQAALNRSLLKVNGEWGAQIEAALTEVGLWPFSGLKTRKQFDDAANTMIPLLQQAGVMP